MLRTAITPSLFKFSRISSSVQGPKSSHRITPLQEFRVWCKEILTLRSNNFLVDNKFSTRAFFSTSKSKSPDFNLLILFGWPAIDWMHFSIAKGDRSDTFRSFSSDFTTKKRGTFKVGCEVDCWVVCSESEDSSDSSAFLRFFCVLWRFVCFLRTHERIDGSSQMLSALLGALQGNT